MEKAILKTLIYADIFDYPLKAWEIHKWLIGKPLSLQQVEKALNRLIKNKKVKTKNGYYFLSQREGLILKRKRREKQSARYLKKAKILTKILKIIPWIKLVGISGGLAMENAAKSDDIDLIIIAENKKLWTSRLLTLALLTLTTQRRKVGDSKRNAAGRFCLNIVLEEESLIQENKNIFIAHEVLQMKVLWQRDGVYSKYLEVNDWAFKFLPNWIGDARGPAGSQTHSMSLTSLRALNGASRSPLPLANFAEFLAKQLQLKVMREPKGMERIEDGALYFHPKDCGPKVLSEYERRVKK